MHETCILSSCATLYIPPLLLCNAEDDKTTTQKDREAQLLRELIELIDERDDLERKRMSTERK